ncbi:MAG: hypothetical protein Q4E22_05700, partial [Coriobacteriia bacterium]|nr:hypothetical protein [Coriobacteriia bacterium]
MNTRMVYEKTLKNNQSEIKVIYLFLTFLCIFSYSIFGTLLSTAYATEPGVSENSSKSNNTGELIVDKTAKKNPDGTYKLTLEAYADGEISTGGTDSHIPADIVLVLDQSASMNDYMSYDFIPYTNKTNRELYALRHNGGESPNLYHKLDNGGYIPVNVSDINMSKYEEYPVTSTNAYYYENNDNVYRWSGQEYLKITMTRQLVGLHYAYYYSTNATSYTNSWWYESTRALRSPGLFTGWGPLYYYVGKTAKFTYTYTDRNGEIKTIGEST